MTRRTASCAAGSFTSTITGIPGNPLSTSVEGRHSCGSAAKGIAPSAVGSEAGAGIDRCKARERKRSQRAAAIGGAIQRGIVQHDRDAIGGEPNVELEGVGALLHRQLKGGHGILGCGTGRAAMSYDRPGRQIQERVHGWR